MYRNFIKPGCDLICSLFLIILATPVFLMVSLVIILTMGRPIFFKQVRPGKDEKLFTIYKFRTMSNARDGDGKLLPDEERLGRVGKVIRSLSLDELPQLVNVLKGEMSFIGPRPLLVEYLPLYTQEQKKRHNVKPGITGWAQVNGRNAISWKRKFEYDVYYVDHLSFLFDLKIIFLTIIKIMKRNDVNAEGHVTTTPFKGNEDE